MLCASLVFLTALSLSAAEVWFDFERTGLASDWNQPTGEARLSWEKALVDEAAPADEDKPAGQALRIKGPAKGFAYTKRDLLPANLADQEIFAMQIRGHGGNAPATIEVQFIEPDGKSKFWRKVEVADQEWRELRLPLKYFRTSGTRLPQWDRLRFFGLYLRTPAEFSVDNLRFVSRPGANACLGVPDLREIAFGDRPEARLQAGTNWLVLTDCADLDLAEMSGRLQKLADDLRRDFAFFPPPATPPTLIIFAHEQHYRDFPLRLAGRFNSQAERAGSDGYTMMGIATSYWDPQKGARRPVYYHEFVHSWMEKAGRFADDGGWLHEGIANYYQLQLFPQSNFNKLVQEGLTKENFRLPLRELCSGRRIPVNRYWQALTVVDLLLNQPPYSQKRRALLEAFREGNSTDLNLYLEKILETNWDAFEKDWKAFCRQRYP